MFTVYVCMYVRTYITYMNVFSMYIDTYSIYVRTCIGCVCPFSVAKYLCVHIIHDFGHC